VLWSRFLGQKLFFWSRGLSVFRITKSEKWSNGQGQFVPHGRYS